jgi:antitoxin component HigA of HigAB toxin-antitoxin module
MTYRDDLTFTKLFERAEEHDDYRLAGAILKLTEDVVCEMDRQGISRAELARRLGSTPTYVTKVLRGKVNLTLSALVELARALGSEVHVRIIGSSVPPRVCNSLTADRVRAFVLDTDDVP